jgi:DMSO/TMAO reductase YedYZ heme-binding membrane subunit
MSVRRATQSATQPGGTLGTGRDWRRRLTFHHTPIGFTSAVALVLLLGLSPFAKFGHGDTSLGFDPGRLGPGSDAFVSRLTTSSGYVALGLLGLTLLVGPANLLLRRRNPVSTYLRRDLGTWTAIFSVIHVIAGFEVGDGGTFGFLDFFVADGRPLTSSFGLGNWTGLAALVIVVGLLAISTNRSVRELKAERWKNLQRLNYTLFALVVLHSIFYGALSRMTSPFTIILIYTVTAVLVGQAVGIWLWRRRGSRTELCVTPRRPGEAHESDPRAGRGARGHATRLTLLIALFAAVFAGAVLVARSEEQVADRGDGQPAAARETQPDPLPGRRTTQDGLRLALDRTKFASDASGEPLSFRILDAQDRPVRDFEVKHERKMHLILERRDLAGFQHLHPTMRPDGTWTIGVDFGEGGTYRVFADFTRDGEQRTLGADVQVGGSFSPRPLPAPARVVSSDGGLEVRLLAGAARAGKDARLEFEVRDGGRVVTDRLQPYLGAKGHLVALREGDLAYLHTHPDSDELAFTLNYPSATAYRLFVQFRYQGRIHTAAFTQGIAE